MADLQTSQYQESLHRINPSTITSDRNQWHQDTSSEVCDGNDDTRDWIRQLSKSKRPKTIYEYINGVPPDLMQNGRRRADSNQLFESTSSMRQSTAASDISPTEIRFSSASRSKFQDFWDRPRLNLAMHNVLVSLPSRDVVDELVSSL